MGLGTCGDVPNPHTYSHTSHPSHRVPSPVVTKHQGIHTEGREGEERRREGEERRREGEESRRGGEERRKEGEERRREGKDRRSEGEDGSEGEECLDVGVHTAQM